MNFRKWIWPFVTHTVVAATVFTGAFYFFAFLGISAEINRCGTGTDHTIAIRATGERVGLHDSVCGWVAPGHNVQVYHVSAGGKQEAIAHYSANTFVMPHATWTRQGELVIEVPHAQSISGDLYAKSSVTIKFGHVP